jgi:hypothetical protein
MSRNNYFTFQNPDIAVSGTDCNTNCYNGKYGTRFPYGGYQNYAACTCYSCGVCADATSLDCVQCKSGFCPSGQYLDRCGNGTWGTCKLCPASCPPGQYGLSLIGCGRTTSGCAACPSCPAGQYNAGCSTSSQGQCTSCAPCAAGTVRLGCGGVSPGACATCDTPAARALIAGGDEAPSREVLVLNGGFESYGPLITDPSATVGGWIAAPQDRGWAYSLSGTGNFVVLAGFSDWSPTTRISAPEGRVYAALYDQAQIEQNVTRLAAGEAHRPPLQISTSARGAHIHNLT